MTDSSGSITISQYLAKRWQKMKIPSKALLFVAAIQGGMMIAVASLNIVSHDCLNNPSIFCSKFVTNQAIALYVWTVFFYISVFDGLFWGNMYELYAAMFLSLFVTGWSIWRKIEPGIKNSVEDIFLISNCITQLIYICVGWFLYKEYGWVLWKKAGSDVNKQKMYKSYLLWSCFQKLDMTFCSYCLLFSGQGIYNFGWETGVDIGMGVLLAITIVTGYIFVKKEWSLLTKIWFVILPIMPIYVIVLFYLQNDFPTGDYSLYIPFRICGALLFISRLLLVYYTIVLINFYGKGLINLTSLEPDKNLIDDDEDEIEDIYYEPQIHTPAVLERATVEKV